MIPTAEEFLLQKFREIYDRFPEAFKEHLTRERFAELHVTGSINGFEQTYPEMLIEFTKMHCEAQAEAIRNNVSLRQSSSEEVNENDIYPFVTAADSTVWVINEDTVINAYPLTNIK